MQLYARCRPTSWDQVVGQDRIVQRLARLAQRSLGGRAYWLSGKSGVGKTTLAYLIAHAMADQYAIWDLDATEILPGQIRDLEKSHAVRPIGEKGGWAVIVNEAQGLRRDTIKQLLVTLERIPSHVVWCFTTIHEDDGNLFGTDVHGHPLLSRCVDCQLASGEPVVLAFALKAQEIAQAENLDGQPLEAYIELVRRHRCNLRSVLVEIESGAMLTA